MRCRCVTDSTPAREQGEGEHDGPTATPAGARRDRPRRPGPRGRPGPRVPQRHRQAPRCSPRRRRSSWPSASRRASSPSTCSTPPTPDEQCDADGARGAGPRRPPRQEPPARGQPSPRRVARQALHRPRHAAARPDPGRQPRPDPRRREVRLHQGLQVLHLRHVVDPPGHHPRHGRPGPHDPAARPPRRAGQQARPHQARPAPAARPRGHPRGAGRRGRPDPGEGLRPARPRARPGEPGHAGRRRGGRPAGRLHRGRRGHRRRERRDLRPAARRPAPRAGDARRRASSP